MNKATLVFGYKDEADIIIDIDTETLKMINCIIRENEEPHHQWDVSRDPKTWNTIQIMVNIYPHEYKNPSVREYTFSHWDEILAGNKCDNNLRETISMIPGG